MNAQRQQSFKPTERFDSLTMNSLFSYEMDIKNGAELSVEGDLPDWLTGDLFRTAPAVFNTQTWAANHWFDALGMLYKVSLRAGEAPLFHQALVESDFARQARSGRVELASFDTPDQRTSLGLLLNPVPKPTDNGNVNIVKAGEKMLALTETDRTLEIDPKTLRTVKELSHHDLLPRNLFATAHPLPDLKKNCLVNVAPYAGLNSSVEVYEQDLSTGNRKTIASIPVQRLPYIHSFGLTEKHVILVLHPFEVNPLTFLWSRNFLSHYRWRPDEGTIVILIDRTTGNFRKFQTEAFFTFHIVNAFERGSEVVVDLLAYDGPETLTNMRVDSMSTEFPSLEGSLRRIVLDLNTGRIRTECLLSEYGIEFPMISPLCRGVCEQQFIWGASVCAGNVREVRSTLVKFSTKTGECKTFQELPYVLGEPLFVRDPQGQQEDQGVLLSVGSHVQGKNAKLFVLDAKELTIVAGINLPVPVPFGFHGTFVRNQKHSL